ncbi:protein SHQ1 homolog isoform X2 [Cyclopterus lumpus]|uniref:protein SHQ1 homolog isoform X2 n=1 Tax=Cyclopterus lumpus TaxID=8103 RepID=UPI001485FC1B|nr:protein SHQ1 homolog isoform X2 [Cyclopterus lumpus]
MITPAFDLSQDPEFLILSIRVPYTRTSEFDLHVDGADFKFFAKPYFLRLSLPGRIVEDGRETAKFDIDEGLVTLRVPKETAGEHFEGLQMLTSLLAPKGSRSARPLIEDLSTGSGEGAMGGDDEEEDDEEDFDWQVEQEVYKESSEEELGALQKYGFGNQRCGVFARLQEELSDVTDVKNPEGTTAAERRQGRLDAEAAAFSPDHYLADLFEDDEIKGLLKFSPWWEKLSPLTEQEGEAEVSFTDDEKEQLRKFANRSYLLDKTSRQQTWLSLVDVLLAYCYEARSTEGEHNTYSSLQDVLASFGRRVLCYPLYRHFAMASAAVRDTTKILQSGKACVLRCLLDIHRVFRENEPAYILNDLYITDYCVWIQRVKSKKMSALAVTLQKASLRKKDLELDLEELEEAATMVAGEEEEEEEEGEAPTSHSDDSEASSGSSGDSSDESEKSEAEGQSCTASNEGGGGGTGTCKDNPLQPRTISAASPIPREPASALLSAESAADALPSASRDSCLLIQELGERVAEELTISPNSGCGQAESAHSRADGAAATFGGSGGGTLLEPSPRRNPLLIVPDAMSLPRDGCCGTLHEF